MVADEADNVDDSCAVSARALRVLEQLHSLRPGCVDPSDVKRGLRPNTGTIVAVAPRLDCQ